MSSDLHRRAKELFLEACELSDRERHDFIADACGSDPELRAEVESLFAFHDADATTTQNRDGGLRLTETEPPTSIGTYRIIQLVGEGGMGEVYEAEQEHPVRRRVALKLIKWGMDTREVVARFDTERQALALMDHPNIAKVFEAGATDEGRPYFAMEYVRGIPITEYCDANRLSTSDRLEIFVLVCDAVQHAHRRGVIHRDIKPSNILVTVHDGRPVPKIIDFGVAKATSQRLTERTVFTELGQWIGTPEYMSPEQAEMTGLDVDTRTDVYSLGVVLYELLAGVQPFEADTLRSAGFDEMRRRIREEDPPRPSTRVSSLGHDSEIAARRRRTDPSTLVRELKGDLDWIVMKALEKDRTRRYGSPADLAADINRHLANLPVEASPPSTTYRLGKFIRRNRIAVAAAAAIVATLVVGIAGTTIGLVQARREARTAHQVARFMEGIFADLDPSESGGTQSPEMILDRGVAKIEQELVDQPLVQARLMTTMGFVYLNLGRFDQARSLMERGLELRSQNLDADHPDMATSFTALGWFHYRTGDFRRSEEFHQRALEIRERSHGPLDSRVAQDARHLARVHWAQNRFETAESYYRRSLEILDRGQTEEALELASTLHWYAIFLIDRGEVLEALDHLDRALAIRQETMGPNHPYVAWTLTESGRAHNYLGNYRTSEAEFRRSLEILESAFGPDAWGVAFPVSGLGEVLRSVGRLRESLEMFERALEIRRGLHGSTHIELLWSMPGYGWTQLALGNLEEAVQTFRQTIDISRTLFPDGHHIESSPEMGLGLALYEKGQHDDAVEHVERALEITERSFPPGNLWLAWRLTEYGAFRLKIGDCDRSREPMERAVAIWEDRLGRENINVVKGLLELARWERQCGDPNRAPEILDRAVAIIDRNGMADLPMAAAVRAERLQP
jgi:non-specific serine/threonine protein kinase/serine/threonine-protein kinase